MKLTAKTLLLLLLVTLISFTAAISIQRFISIPALIELEAKSDRKDAERVVIGFDVIRQSISTLAYDYGIWDDTYHYFNDPDTDYIESSFDIGTFISNEINIVLLADTMGKVIWSRYADLEEETILPDGFFNAQELSPFLANANNAFPGAPVSVSGIINTSIGPMIYASYSVLKSNESGTSPGSILMARRIDQQVAHNVQEMVKIPFELEPLKWEQALDFKVSTLDEQYRDSKNRFHWYISDIVDQPVLKVSLMLDKRAFDDSLISSPLLAFLATILLSWGLIILTLDRTLIQPIKKVGKHLFYIRSSGDFSARLNNPKLDEIGNLSNECDLLIQYIQRQNQIVEQQAGELERLSYEDSLTELANRRRFDQLLNDYWQLAIREQHPVSLLLCDIDYFKKYNDNYGHQSGDKALVKVANILKTCISRTSDLAARYGGEEFVIILPDTNEKGAETVARRLQQKIREAAITHAYSNISTFLTMSIGMATTTPQRTESSAVLLKHTDEALYEAKARGRNRSIRYLQENQFHLVSSNTAL